MRGGGVQSWRNAKNDYAAKLRFDWQRFFASGGVSLVGKGFDVSEIGYLPWTGVENYSLSCGYLCYQKWIFRSLSVYSYVRLGRESSDPGLGNYFGFGQNAQLKNNWGFTSYVNLSRDYEQAQWFESVMTSFWGWTDWTKPIALSLSGWWVSNTPYYRSGVFSHFAPQANLNSTLNWKPNPSLSFSLEVNSTLEYDSTRHIERLDWIFRPRLCHNQRSLSPAKELVIFCYQ